MRRRLALGALLAGAVALRLPGLYGRSLWLDEAWVANLAAAASLGQFWRAVSCMPVPPLFALGLHGIFLVAGRSAAALRALPLGMSVAAVPMAYVLGRRWFGRPGGMAAAVCFAAYPIAVAYGQELKQYSTDVAVVLALLLLGDDVRRRPVQPGPWCRFAMLAALAPGLSYPAALVVPAIAAALLPASRASGTLPSWVAANAAAAGAALVWYALVIQTQRAQPVLAAYWSPGFMPAGTTQAVAWLRARIGALVAYLVDRPPWLFGLAVLAGYAVAPGHLAATAAMVAGAVLGAAALGLYPLAPGRTSLFLLPFFYLPLAALAARLATVGWPRGATPLWQRAARAPALIAAAALLLFPARGALRARADLLVVEDIEPLLRWVAAERKPSDRVYVYYGAAPAFRFYYPRYDPHMRAGDPRITFGSSHRNDPSAYEAELRRILVRGERVWLIFSHIAFTARGEPERNVILSAMRLYGRQLAMRRTRGASAHLYVVTRRPESVRHLRLRPEDLRNPERLRELLGRPRRRAPATSAR